MFKSTAFAIIALALSLESCGIVGTFTSNITFGTVSDSFTFDDGMFSDVRYSSITKTSVVGAAEEYLLAFYGQSNNYGVGGRRGIWSQAYKNGVWGDPVLIVEEKNASRTIGNPSLLQVSSETIVLFYTTDSSGRYNQLQVRKLTMDKGQWGTVSDPTCSHSVSSKPLLVNGGFFFGFSGQRNGNWVASMQYNENDVFRCPKYTQLYNASSPVGSPVPFLTTDSLPICLFCVENGTVFMARADSEFKSWGQMQPFTLPCTASAFDVAVLTDNEFMVVHNNPSSSNLVVSVMDYGGDLRPALFSVQDQPNGKFLYPSAIRPSQNRVHITYAFNNLRIKHVVLNVTITYL